jgi:hypothetical protein
MLKHIITNFNITHSYFSSPLTCCTQLKHFYSPYPRDCIFRSIGTAFSHKWRGYGFAYPPPPFITTTSHMARLAAKEDPQSYTILVNSDPNWHQNTNHYHQIYPDIHVIAYIPPNTLQYHEPINPSFNENSYIDTHAIQLLCIHHRTSPIGDTETLNQITHLINIPLCVCIAPPTPPYTKVKNDKTWHTLPTLFFPPYTNSNIPLFPHYTFALPLKFPLEYSYYTDGSFTPPKQIAPNTWHPEMASYGIFNPSKNLQISERLPGLQNILRAELTAIYTVLQLSTKTYTNEPIYIFTDSLNSLYLLNMQLRHPSAYNNHPDKTILLKMIKLLQIRTHPTYLYKVKAHSNITGNEIVDGAKAHYSPCTFRQKKVLLLYQ